MEKQLLEIGKGELKDSALAVQVIEKIEESIENYGNFKETFVWINVYFESFFVSNRYRRDSSFEHQAAAVLASLSEIGE